jgi:predicted DNA-binding WGR domain protein
MNSLYIPHGPNEFSSPECCLQDLIEHGFLELRAINPDRNIARFYSLRVNKNLFGELTLTVTNGRIGKKGRVQNSYWPSIDLLIEEVKKRLKRRFSSVPRLGVKYAVRKVG